MRGNGPDPANVSHADGVVKYELTPPRISNQTGKPYPDFDDRVFGTLLVEMLDERKVRVEVFPGKESEEARGFTVAAMVYER